jgi:ankyrin repeat protein
MARAWIENGANANAVTIAGVTTLHLASWKVSAEMTRLLNNGGEDVHATDYRGYTPVHNLCIPDYEDVEIADTVNALLESSLESLRMETRSFNVAHIKNPIR